MIRDILEAVLYTLLGAIVGLCVAGATLALCNLWGVMV